MTIAILFGYLIGGCVGFRLARREWRREFMDPRYFGDYAQELFVGACGFLIWPLFLVVYGSWRAYDRRTS